MTMLHRCSSCGQEWMHAHTCTRTNMPLIVDPKSEERDVAAAMRRLKSGEMGAKLTFDQRQALSLACRMLFTDFICARDCVDAVREPSPDVFVFELSGTPPNAAAPEAWTWRVEIEHSDNGDVRVPYVTRIEVRREP